MIRWIAVGSWSQHRRRDQVCNGFSLFYPKLLGASEKWYVKYAVINVCFQGFNSARGLQSWACSWVVIFFMHWIYNKICYWLRFKVVVLNVRTCLKFPLASASDTTLSNPWDCWAKHPQAGRLLIQLPMFGIFGSKLKHCKYIRGIPDVEALIINRSEWWTNWFHRRLTQILSLSVPVNLCRVFCSGACQMLCGQFGTQVPHLSDQGFISLGFGHGLTGRGLQRGQKTHESSSETAQSWWPHGIKSPVRRFFPLDSLVLGNCSDAIDSAREHYCTKCQVIVFNQEAPNLWFQICSLCWSMCSNEKKKDFGLKSSSD